MIMIVSLSKKTRDKKAMNVKLEYAFVTLFAFSVCQSVSLSGLHLNSPVIILSIKPTANFTGNKNQNFQTVFSENSSFQRYSTCAISIYSYRVSHFSVIAHVHHIRPRGECSTILFSYSEGEDTHSL